MGDTKDAEEIKTASELEVNYDGIAEPIKVILQEDGTVTGNKLQGSWEMAEGTYYM